MTYHYALGPDEHLFIVKSGNLEHVTLERAREVSRGNPIWMTPSTLEPIYEIYVKFHDFKRYLVCFEVLYQLPVLYP